MKRAIAKPTTKQIATAKQIALLNSSVSKLIVQGTMLSSFLDCNFFSDSDDNGY
jgi:hypothetical protein